MSQITSGMRSILSHPFVYDLMQNFMGARRSRKFFSNDVIRSRNGDRILDIGCGTAEIINYLPNVDYHGYDISEKYIESARLRFKSKGQFYCKTFSLDDAKNNSNFDIVLSLGVLHHMDDDVATGFIETAYAALKPGGRLVTIDPVFTSDQSPVARYLISKDRGVNVRCQQAYLDLIPEGLFKVKSFVRHQAWIPYTHFCLVAEK